LDLEAIEKKPIIFFTILVATTGFLVFPVFIHI
jgi:hypothetical protein